MRLLNVHTIQLKHFQDHDRPRYAIASHLWTTEEATLRDVRDGKNRDSRGFDKIVSFAKYVYEHFRVEWLWYDSCCVDIASAAEISESINLMFDYYRDAEVCITHLGDVDVDIDKSAFRQSRWFTRVWTLPELLAPHLVIFVTNKWHVIGHKGTYGSEGTSEDFMGPNLESDIAQITGVPGHVLRDFETSRGLHIDERLKWVDGRQSVRGEDMSYALYGIFGVALGANYGEGQIRARQRLLAGIRESFRWQNDFQYTPLDDPRSETRILRILNTGESEPIRCSISHISLNNPPEYTALSYRWGDRAERSTILIAVTDTFGDREARFPATVSLEAALRELRRRGVFSIWADMICINQEDLSERNQQVTIMGNIYAMATKVVAWTGLECDGSSAAIRAMLPDNRTLSIASTGTGSGAASLVDLQCVREFLSRPYFTRMWIIQELAKARSAELWCGKDTLGLEDFITFVSASQTVKLSKSQKILFEALRLFCTGERQALIGRPRMLLAEALVASRSAQATDPRDNIYAVLGLTRDGNDVVPVPDYRKSVEDVFAAASGYMIGLQGQVSLILLARGFAAGRKPSWMGAWDNSTPLPPWIEECIHGERDTWTSSCKIVKNTLSVLGYMVDEVMDNLSQDDSGNANVPLSATSRGQKLDMQDWLNRFMEDPDHLHSALRRTTTSRSDILSGQPAPASRELELLALESGVQGIARYSMRLVRFRHRGFRIAHRDAQDGDQIWRLENCPLPVVLRPLFDNSFTFIGEVHADTRNRDWWQSTWSDLDTGDASGTRSGERRNDVDFDTKKSSVVHIQ